MSYLLAVVVIFAVVAGVFLLARPLANLIILAIIAIAVLVEFYAIAYGPVYGIGQVIASSLGVGFVASMIALPLLPFSSFIKR